MLCPICNSKLDKRESEYICQNEQCLAFNQTIPIQIWVKLINMRDVLEQFASIDIENHQRVSMGEYLGHPIWLLGRIKEMSVGALDMLNKSCKIPKSMV